MKAFFDILKSFKLTNMELNDILEIYKKTNMYVIDYVYKIKERYVFWYFYAIIYDITFWYFLFILFATPIYIKIVLEKDTFRYNTKTKLASFI
jgi:hypothetical protein